MKELKQIEAMLDMQVELNNFTNGEQWVTGITKENREINWLRCIRQEVSEFIDSFNWKHWKAINAKEDFENARMELIDIWHFLMSEALTRYNITYAANLLFEGYDHAIKEELCELTSLDICESAEYMQQLTFNNTNYEDNIIKLSISLFSLLKELNMSIDDVYKLYLSKNVLNIFRQNNGYKENTYIKEWNIDEVSKEDNVVLKEIINELSEDELTKDIILDKLQITYNNFK